MSAGMPIPMNPPDRVTLRDCVRTLYIQMTMVGALVFLVLGCGWFFWIAGHTFDRRRRIARRMSRGIFARLLRHYAWITGRPLELVMPEIAWKELGPCIVVANHASSMDIVALMELPVPAGMGRVWAKGWPFKKPLLGWLMKLCGHLLVEDFNLLPDAEECLADGESLLVFPESSRSRSGKVARFRDGAFLLAVRTRRPIVVVAIRGTFACMPPGRRVIFRPVVRVEVLGVLRAGGGGEREHMELKRQAFEMIRGALAGGVIEKEKAEAA